MWGICENTPTIPTDGMVFVIKKEKEAYFNA